MTPTASSNVFRAGYVLPALDKGLLTSSRIARWCAAQENWDRIHYDLDYATKIAGLPGLLINGALKQHLLCQLIEAAFGIDVWLWRLEFKFVGLDLVGQGLTAGGCIKEVRRWRDMSRADVEVWITNDSTGQITTTGRATLLIPDETCTLLDAVHLKGEEDESAIPARPDTDETPDDFAGRVGSILEELESFDVIEQSRLRLFAEAVGDVAPLHYDESAALESPFGSIVAFPLFPIHAISLRPGRRDLSVDPNAMGREGVCEVGRDFSTLLGLPPTGFLNGGNRTQIHSLAKVGDRVHARSRLLSVKKRSGKRGGDMLIFETQNDYWTDRKVPLLTEQQTTICLNAAQA